MIGNHPSTPAAGLLLSGYRGDIGTAAAPVGTVYASTFSAVEGGMSANLVPPSVPDVWPLFEKRYFFYDPNTPNAAATLMTQLRIACAGANPRYSLPSEFASQRSTSNYPVFAILFIDNFDVYALVSGAGNPQPCVIGMATWNGDLDFSGTLTGNDEYLLGLFYGGDTISGDLNNDGVVDSADYAIMTELLGT